MASFSDYNHQWSYYLAIESQLENTSRYVEFTQSNSLTYSIEFARILLSAASETDVVLKEFCKILNPTANADKEPQYRKVVQDHYPGMIDEVIHMTRFSIDLQPWSNWGSDNKTPDWWTANNKVKHHRNTDFAKANLKNAMHAVGALHILLVHYYKRLFSITNGSEISFSDTTSALIPEAKLFTMNDDYYNHFLIVG
ncbi:hypothetical protein [Hymenobacter coccineus]|uniref:hypothetical protein n=1 Tax=Hymenobacter coccineus TaxID=1908235 RepID=UPI000F7821C0|nr:hypothetical protein [Hymenobacter coccineus]